MVGTLSKARVATLMPIKNMERAIKFYTKCLGAKLLYRGQGEMKDDFAGIRVADSEFWLITPSKREKRTVAYQMFLVKNIKASVKQLQATGVKFDKAEKMGPDSRIEGPITFESFGAAAFFKDSEGNLLALWQNNPPM